MSNFARLTSPRAWSNIVALIGIGLLVASTLRIRNDKAQLAQARFESRMPHAGLWFPELRVPGIARDTITLAKAGERQVFFYLQSTCEFCRQSLPMWNRLADTVAAHGDSLLKVYGIQIDTVVSTRSYQQTHSLHFDVVRFPGLRDSRVFAARATPYIVVVDTIGRVSYARAQALLTVAAFDSVVAAILPQRPSKHVATVPTP